MYKITSKGGHTHNRRWIVKDENGKQVAKAQWQDLLGSGAFDATYLMVLFLYQEGQPYPLFLYSTGEAGNLADLDWKDITAEAETILTNLYPAA